MNIVPISDVAIMRVLNGAVVVLLASVYIFVSVSGKEKYRDSNLRATSGFLFAVACIVIFLGYVLLQARSGIDVR